MATDLFQHEHPYWLEEFKHGDESAFTQLYNAYSKPLYRKILAMVKDEEQAKEVLQDLFLKIWVNREKIDTTKSFRAYLYTVAANLVYDHFRCVARTRELSLKLIRASVEGYEHADQRLIEKDNFALISNAIDQLSPQRKKIYVMCRLDGKSYQEVSSELAISPSTIRDHIVKANRVVKDYLLRHPEQALLLFFTSVFV